MSRSFFNTSKSFYLIGNILHFSNQIKISQIPHFLKKKTEQKEELEVSIQNLYHKINKLENLQKDKEQELQSLSEMLEKCPTIIDYLP